MFPWPNGIGKKMDLASWISAGAAVVTLFGGGFAYFQAHLSKKARTATKGERERAERSEYRAQEAAYVAEQQLQAARDQVGVLEQQLAAIANAVKETASQAPIQVEASGSKRVRVQWVKNSLYAIVNDSPVPVQIELVRNREDFVRIELADSFTLSPGQQKTFLAIGAWGHPIPDNLILDEVGADVPLYLPIPEKQA
ncbi:hypothetical protein HMPREF2960_04650 [Corynebacterium sp. HMSC070B05]|nr:hypothetical protein HMPREF2681_01450 [Corynebacterium sp. HMSC064H12]OFQ03066.1 hypothetical protein HMPREF2960_04650 [Corynebacterium sp. HMSC070B05]